MWEAQGPVSGKPDQLPFHAAVTEPGVAPDHPMGEFAMASWSSVAKQGQTRTSARFGPSPGNERSPLYTLTMAGHARWRPPGHAASFASPIPAMRAHAQQDASPWVSAEVPEPGTCRGPWTFQPGNGN